VLLLDPFRLRIDGCRSLARSADRVPPRLASVRDRRRRPFRQGGAVIAAPSAHNASHHRTPRKKKRPSLAIMHIRAAFRNHAARRRQFAVNGWTSLTTDRELGFEHGLMCMALSLGRLTGPRYQQLRKRMQRISEAEITRLDARLLYVRPAS
jgi:ribosomal protein L4